MIFFSSSSFSAIRCPDLNMTSINGVIINDCDTTFGTTCQLQCRDQYRPIAGDDVITCLATKRWSGTPLQCESIAIYISFFFIFFLNRKLQKQNAEIGKFGHNYAFLATDNGMERPCANICILYK